ncbi:MAG TPA: hypothetical protein VGG62_10690 [Terracidiphilus sp.]|jgi:hypothetical protein
MPRKKKAEDPRSVHEKQKEFLAAFGDTLSVARAADLANVDRHDHYNWLRRHKSYSRAFEQAREIAGQCLEAEAVDRALSGWLEPVYYQGAVCGDVRRYDSGLTQFLLRGLLPERYGSKTEITGPQGTPLQVKIEVEFVKPSDPSADPANPG